MRNLLAALLLTAACGGTEAGMQTADQSDLSDSCGGLKSAHCFCQVVGGPMFTTGSPDQIRSVDIDGQLLITYRIPNKCYNQQADILNSHLGGGCWKDCRDAFGIEGHAVGPGVQQDIADASQELLALGACGSGWMNGPFSFGAGTNKQRSASGSGIGIGLRGSVVVVNGQKQCR